MTSLRHHGLFYDLRPLAEADMDSAIALYQQPEACLATEPVRPADRETVEIDMEMCQEEGWSYRGIFHPTGPLAGIVSYLPADNPEYPGAASIHRLMIAPQYLDDGLGQAVVQEVEAEVRQDSHARKILAGAASRNVQALRFWQENGYTRTSGSPLLADKDEMSLFEKEFPLPAEGPWSIDFSRP